MLHDWPKGHYFLKKSFKKLSVQFDFLSWECFEDFASQKVLNSFKKLTTENNILYSKLKVQQIILKFYLCTECVNFIKSVTVKKVYPSFCWKVSDILIRKSNVFTKNFITQEDENPDLSDEEAVTTQPQSQAAHNPANQNLSFAMPAPQADENTILNSGKERVVYTPGISSS